LSTAEREQMLRDGGGTTSGAAYFGNMIGDNAFEVQFLKE
jgi:hypothetical protein